MYQDIKTGIVLLAAGASSRMGRNKLAVKFKGNTLLERTIGSAMDAGLQKIIVVTGANREENTVIAERFPVEIVFNPDWQKGIGTSIKCGLRCAEFLYLLP